MVCPIGEVKDDEYGLKYHDTKSSESSNNKTNDDYNDNHGSTKDQKTKKDNSSSNNDNKKKVYIHSRNQSWLASFDDYYQKNKNLGSWNAILISFVASMGLVRELSLQKHLTSPPHIFSQDGNKQMPEYFDRNICPSLFIGTRSKLASTAAYILPHHHEHTKVIYETINTLSWGGSCVLEWHLPQFYHRIYNSSTEEKSIRRVIEGNISTPIVLLLHGINNSASFGYMKRLAQTITDKLQWIAIAMNFRGCSSKNKLTTPRGYNAGYTGDLRMVFQILKSRSSSHFFCVGHSLGANLLCKYLGEEGSSSILTGAASLANPLKIHSNNVPFPYNFLIGWGIQKYIRQNYHSFSSMDRTFTRTLHSALDPTKTIGQIDQFLAPHLLRNTKETTELGFADAEEYWKDASSIRFISEIQTPILLLVSQDDDLINTSMHQYLHHCVSTNPNITVVQTRCGGHLGWQESCPSGESSLQSWSDMAIIEYFQHLYLQQPQTEYHETFSQRDNDKGTTAPQIKSKL